MLRYATPLTFAALGGLVSERSGVVNIALEGMMLMGAFFAAYGADKTGSWVGGIAHRRRWPAWRWRRSTRSSRSRCAPTRSSSGTALNFVALGLTGYMYVDTYGEQRHARQPAGGPRGQPADRLAGLHRPGDQRSSTCSCGARCWRSCSSGSSSSARALGLRLRSVGENPKAAETVGISVFRIRYAAVIASGGLAALGGAFLSIGFVHSFSQNMTAGRGFIALAALIFGRWRPGGLLAATLLFGFSSALAQRLPEFSPQLATLFQALPYVLTLIAVAGVVGRSTPPAADGVPYTREGK